MQQNKNFIKRPENGDLVKVYLEPTHRKCRYGRVIDITRNNNGREIAVLDEIEEPERLDFYFTEGVVRFNSRIEKE